MIVRMMFSNGRQITLELSLENYFGDLTYAFQETPGLEAVEILEVNHT